MKKSIILIISIVISISILAVTIFAISSLDQNEQAQLSTTEIISSLAKTKDGIFSVSKLNQKEIFSDLSTENLKEIFDAFDVIIDQNETIELSSQVNFYLENNKLEISKDGKCYTKNCQDKDQLKLAMLISVYVTNFPNAVAPYFLNSNPDRISVKVHPYLFISFDYDEYGFENAVDYLVSCRDEDTEYGDKTFVFKAYDCDMWLCKDNSSQNRLGFVGDGLTQREKAFSKTE